MLDIIFLGYGTIGNDLFAIWDSEYDHVPPAAGEQDIDQAKFLLKQAGHESLSVQLVTTPLAQGTVQAATVLAQQASAAGVTINLKSITGTAFFNDYLKWTFAQDYWYYQPVLPAGGRRRTSRRHCPLQRVPLLPPSTTTSSMQRGPRHPRRHETGRHRPRDAADRLHRGRLRHPLLPLRHRRLCQGAGAGPRPLGSGPPTWAAFNFKEPVAVLMLGGPS